VVVHASALRANRRRDTAALAERIYEHWPSEQPYGTLDALCQAEIGVPATLVARTIQEVETERSARERSRAAALVTTGDVSGVYAVGTLASARRRGVNTAATWAAVAAGRAWGTDTIALQASEMGFSLYAAMGFRTVVPYASFKRATA